VPRVQAWDRQNELERSLVVLFDHGEAETTLEGQSAVAAAMRKVARDAVSECG
jgi:hypothetical protein